jgi:Domain of unknown function (DUF6458)
MYFGTSIFLIALGAILKFAVTATVAGFNVQTAGVILIVAGIIGLLISIFLEMSARDRRRRDVAVDERPVTRERL